MVILRAFLALAAGFATITLLGLALSALIKKLVPSWAGESKPESPDTNPRNWISQPGPAFVHLGASFLTAAAGGYVTSWAADANPLVHVLALGIVVLALAALSALQSKGEQPVWYLLVQVVISPLGVLIGGLLWLRVQGIL
jgi:hypothetical protein